MVMVAKLERSSTVPLLGVSEPVLLDDMNKEGPVAWAHREIGLGRSFSGCSNTASGGMASVSLRGFEWVWQHRSWWLGRSGSLRVLTGRGDAARGSLGVCLAEGFE